MNNLNLEKELQKYEQSQNKSFALLAKYLLSYEGEFKDLKIISMCNQLFISTATPTRFAQKIGFGGFNELKVMLDNYKTEKSNKIKQYENKDLEYYVEDITKSLQNSFKLFSQEKINLIINQIVNAGKIKIFAVGGSYLSALDFHYKLLRINLPCFIESDRHVQYYMAKNLTASDVAVGISYSGITKEVIKSLDIAKENGAYTILITSNFNIKLDKYDEIIYIAHTEISSRGFSIISRTTVISILDIIYINIINSDKDYYFKLLNNNSFKEY